MNEANTRHLLTAYPALYRQHALPMSETAMCWLFECGDGWFGILDRLSKRITEIDPTVEATQVKEKYGTLRFYVASGPDDVYDAIVDAEGESGRTCEECGLPGQLRDRRGWLMTRCDECWAKEGR